MKRGGVSVSPAGLIFWSFLFFMLPESQAVALLVPVGVHEAGHLLCMKLMGFKIHALSLGMTGLQIDYEQSGRPAAEAVISAAGPTAGIGLWLLCSLAGAELMGGVSLLLSLFNLLPIYPLDGGRICRTILCALFGQSRGKKLQRLLGDSLCCILIGISFYLMLCGYGVGLFAAGLTALLLSLRSD